MVKKNKYPKVPKLPPKKFDHSYETFRGWSGKTKEIIKIKLNPKNKKEVLYFKIILLRLIQNKWKHVLVFDTFHKGKIYLHGHIYNNLLKRKQNLENIPPIKDLKTALSWTRKYLRKNYNKHVRIYLKTIKKNENKN
ncbi:hypothetical protein KKC08_02665 [Patescibacteria group bacterium]|nr:hypothetical protein [Patescibacteria group bacterium]MCG2702565.1 hypothetical protein [Candidatus Parcubacteria bacterium]MBU4210257.1 hypothetical protein [Patescibacteria group bacterium]MBU4265085.1 hypothetical protein [Patescibacteria group bacterium]MBU4389675.1 hypothetical protein [Patescibacteria group bacterium]